MATEYERFTLEETLVLSNEELTSNWSRLASLIYAFEVCQWGEARTKATKLLRGKKAIEYIEDVRVKVKENPELLNEVHKPEPKSVAKAEPKVLQEEKPPIEEKTEFAQNYDRLLKIAPDLVKQLTEHDKNNKFGLYGKSHVSGHKDFNIELVLKFGFIYHFLIYSKQKPSPEMLILVDIEHKIIEALYYKDELIFKKIYSDNIKRKRVNLIEQKAQNDHLTAWLTELVKQGNVIKWKNPKLADSDLGDEFSHTIQKTHFPTKKEVKKSAKSESGKKAEEKKQTNETEQKDEIMEEEKKAQETKPKLEEKKEHSENEFKKPFNILLLPRLIAVILSCEKITDKVKAEKIADELIEKNELAGYLIKAYEKLEVLRTDEIFEANYKLILRLKPNLSKSFESEDSRLVFISSKNKNLPIYEMALGSDIEKHINQFAVYEKKGDDDTNSTLMFGINHKLKLAWVTVIANNFFGQKDYMDEGDDPYSEAMNQVNKSFNNWLIHLFVERYEIPSLNTIAIDSAKQETKTAEAPTPENTTELTRKEWVAPYVENAKKVPDFQPGHVEYCEAHKKAGISKKLINWVNKHRKGLLVKATDTINFNTKSIAMDKAIKANQPGFRLSKTGKMYYENRSNRSDATKTGL